MMHFTEDSDRDPKAKALTARLRRLFGILCKYTENFTPPPPPHTHTQKNSDKNKSDMFQISAQNIDCGYPLEPPRRGGSNE